MPENVGSWFFLKDGRRSFKPDPLRDRALMFCNLDVQNNIQLAIERAFATDETVKLLLWGDWGAGKTHTLRHLEYWFGANQSDYPAQSVFVRIGDIRKDSNFGAIHKDLLDGVGLPALVTHAFSFMQSGRNLVTELDSIGIPQPIIQALNKLYVAVPGMAGGSYPPIVTTAWQYLRGGNVGRAGVELGLPTELSDSKEFYYVLAAIGFLVKQVTGKQLLFLVDEAARLEAVSDVLQVERHWVNVNTMIFDQENRYFGFVYTVSGKDADAIPRALFEPQIENRLGNRRIEIQNLDLSDMRGFIEKLKEHFVDRAALEADDTAKILQNPLYSWDAYPFTPDGLAYFVSYFQREPANAKPRDISERMDSAAFFAMKRESRLIGEELLSELGL